MRSNTPPQDQFSKQHINTKQYPSRNPEDKRSLEGPGDMQEDRTKKILPNKMIWPGQEAAVGSVGSPDGGNESWREPSSDEE